MGLCIEELYKSERISKPRWLKRSIKRSSKRTSEKSKIRGSSQRSTPGEAEEVRTKCAPCKGRRISDLSFSSLQSCRTQSHLNLIWKSTSHHSKSRGEYPVDNPSYSTCARMITRYICIIILYHYDFNRRISSVRATSASARPFVRFMTSPINLARTLTWPLRIFSLSFGNSRTTC